MLALIIFLVIVISLLGTIAITINDETSIFWLIAALAIAVFLGMQIEKYKQLEAEKYEQIFEKQS